MTSSQPSKRNIPKWIILGCGALAAIAALCISLSIIISGIPSTETPTPTKMSIPMEAPTDTPSPQPTEPTATPISTDTPLATAPPFEEIHSQIKDMTEAQRKEYIRSLKRVRIVHWTGWVHDVYEKSPGKYELYITLNPPPGDILNAYDISIDIRDPTVLQLQKDQVITFSGQIDSVYEIRGSLTSIHLVDATIEPSPTEPAVTPPPEQFVTIDGYDPASESIIDPINLWKDYNDRAAGIATKAHHSDRVKLIKREDDGILVETTAGVQGWVTYWFIKEFKDEYLSTITTATPTSLPTPTEPPTSLLVATNTPTPTIVPAPTDIPAPLPTESCPYIGNSNTKKFHHAGCSSVRQMKEEHKGCFPSREEAISSGYIPCKRCNP